MLILSIKAILQGEIPGKTGVGRGRISWLRNLEPGHLSQEQSYFEMLSIEKTELR